MKTSQAGINLVKKYEGLSLKKYICPAGKPTIGYGHLILKGENLEVITQQQANDLLLQDLLKAERCIESNVKMHLTQPQFDALADFIFNLGCGNFKSSTLLKLINDEQHLLAAEQFERWVNSNGKPLNGLIKRRAEEKELFLRGC